MILLDKEIAIAREPVPAVMGIASVKNAMSS